MCSLGRNTGKPARSSVRPLVRLAANSKRKVVDKTKVGVNVSRAGVTGVPA